MNPSTARKSPTTGKGPRGKPLTPRALKIVSKLRRKLLETMPPESLPLKHPLSDFVQIYDENSCAVNFLRFPEKRDRIAAVGIGLTEMFPVQSINPSAARFEGKQTPRSLFICAIYRKHMEGICKTLHLLRIFLTVFKSHSREEMMDWMDLLGHASKISKRYAGRAFCLRSGPMGFASTATFWPLACLQPAMGFT